MSKIRFNLRSYTKEIEIKDGFDTIEDAIKDALQHCETLCNCVENNIAVFETREEGLNALEMLTNTYCHYPHFPKNKYEILIHILQEEHYDEDLEKWCVVGNFEIIH